jgi:hypothetical protein
MSSNVYACGACKTLNADFIAPLATARTEISGTLTPTLSTGNHLGRDVYIDGAATFTGDINITSSSDPTKSAKLHVNGNDLEVSAPTGGVVEVCALIWPEGVWAGASSFQSPLCGYAEWTSSNLSWQSIFVTGTVPVTIKMTRIGCIVNMFSYYVESKVTSTSYCRQPVNTIPLEFRPWADNTAQPLMVKNNTMQMGMAVITTGGEIRVYPGPSVSDRFTLGNRAGVALHFTYTRDMEN